MSIPVTIIEDNSYVARSYARSIMNGQGRESDYKFKIYENKPLWEASQNHIVSGVYIVDINLGVGREREGIEIVKKIIEESPESIVFVISANSEAEEEVGGNLKSWDVKFYFKSGDPKELRNILEEVKQMIRDFQVEKGFDTDEGYKNSNNGKIQGVVEGVCSPKFRRFFPMKSMYSRAFLKIPADVSPDLLKVENRFLVKKAIRSKHEKNDVWRGIVSKWEFVGVSKESNGNHESMDQKSDPRLPKYFELKNDENGIIMQLGIQTNGTLEKYSFQLSTFRNWFLNKQFSDDLASRIFIRNIMAHNLNIWYENGKITKEEILSLGDALSLEGRMEFMKNRFETEMGELLPGSLPISELKKELDYVQIEFSSKGDFPSIIDMELGYIEAIDEKKGNVSVNLSSWLNPKVQPKIVKFSLEYLRNLGIINLDDHFIYTTFKLGEISGTGAMVELVDPDLN